MKGLIVILMFPFLEIDPAWVEAIATVGLFLGAFFFGFSQLKTLKKQTEISDQQKQIIKAQLDLQKKERVQRFILNDYLPKIKKSMVRFDSKNKKILSEAMEIQKSVGKYIKDFILFYIYKDDEQKNMLSFLEEWEQEDSKNFESFSKLFIGDKQYDTYLYKAFPEKEIPLGVFLELCKEEKIEGYPYTWQEFKSNVLPDILARNILFMWKSFFIDSKNSINQSIYKIQFSEIQSKKAKVVNLLENCVNYIEAVDHQYFDGSRIGGDPVKKIMEDFSNMTIPKINSLKDDPNWRSEQDQKNLLDIASIKEYFYLWNELSEFIDLTLKFSVIIQSLKWIAEFLIENFCKLP